MVLMRLSVKHLDQCLVCGNQLILIITFVISGAKKFTINMTIKNIMISIS